MPAHGQTNDRSPVWVFGKNQETWFATSNTNERLLLGCRGASFLTSLTPMKSPADSIHFQVVPFFAFCFGPIVFAIGAVIFRAITRTNTSTAKSFAVSA